MYVLKKNSKLNYMFHTVGININGYTLGTLTKIFQDIL